MKSKGNCYETCICVICKCYEKWQGKYFVMAKLARTGKESFNNL